MAKLVNDRSVGHSPNLRYDIDCTFSENSDGDYVNCTVVITMTNYENYYYIMTPYGWAINVTVNGTTQKIVCKAAGTNWSYPASGIDPYNNNCHYYGDAKRTHTASKTFKVKRSADGKLSWSAVYTTVEGVTVPYCGKFVKVSGVVNSGYPAYKKATLDVDAAYPTVTSPNTSTFNCKYNETVLVHYTKNENYTSNDDTKIQYSKDKKTWHNVNMWANKARTEQRKTGNSSGYFTMCPSSDYGGKIIKQGESFKLYIRRYHVGGEDYHSNVVSKTFKTYSVPSVPTISAPSIVQYDKNVKVTFTKDTNYTVGTDIVQFNVNATGWKDAVKTKDGGSFTFKPSDYNVKQGVTFKLYVRRYLEPADYKSSNAVININTYSVPVVKGLNVSPANTVNANTRTKLSWNEWDGKFNESSTCLVELVNKKNDDEPTIGMSFTSTKNAIAIEFTPKTFISTDYDNTWLYFRVTRIHAVTKQKSSPAYIKFKALYRPIKQIVPTTDVPGETKVADNGINYEWTYPSDGYYGIVSGYHYRLINSNDGTTFKERNIVDPVFTLSHDEFLQLKSGDWYSLEITPYYNDYNVDSFRGPAITIDNFIQRIVGLGTPTILYPKQNGYFDSDGDMRIVIQLPEDSNAEDLINYTYAKLVLSINQYNSESDLISRSEAVLSDDLSIISSSDFSTDTLQHYNGKICFHTGNEFFDSNTTYAELYVTITGGREEDAGDPKTSLVTQIKIMNGSWSLKRNIGHSSGYRINYDKYKILANLITQLFASYNDENYYWESDTIFSYGNLIKQSDFEELYRKLTVIKNTTHPVDESHPNGVIYDVGKEDVGFPSFEYFQPETEIIKAGSYLTHLVEAETDLINCP